MSWYSSGLLCSFVINKLKTLREPHSLSLALYSIYTDSTRSISIHHSQSSQSISIYDREIGAKISVSVSISRFLRLHTLLYVLKRQTILLNVASERASVQGERRRLERGIEVRVRPARGGAGVHASVDGRRLPPPGRACTLRPAPWRWPGVVTSH